MDLDEAREALRAKAEQAQRHSEMLRRQAIEQRRVARAQRDAELRVVAERQAAVPVDNPILHCAACNADWRAEDVRDATRRQPGCPLCGRPLTPLP